MRAINEAAHPNDTFTMGENKFSDWTQAEYKQLLGYRKSDVHDEMHDYAPVRSLGDIPASVDWRTKGAVQAVKD